MDAIKADHGFNLDSATIRNLLQVMSQYSASERRDFLQFVTGSPKLPIGGTYKYHGEGSSANETRIQSPDPDVHCSVQAERATIDIGRLSAQRHDMRQLSQVA